MNNQLLNNLTMNETDVIASRRRFLTRMAYGSLLAISGTGIAEAAAKHAVHTPTHNKKTDVKHTSSTHAKSSSHESSHAKHALHDSKSVKNSLHDRLASKSSNNHHSHKELALNSKHDLHRVHSSLHKDHDGNHRLHNNINNRIAMRDTNMRIHSSLQKDRNGSHRLFTDMPEFISQEEDVSPIIHSNESRNRFALRGQNTAFRSNNVAHKTLELRNNTTGDRLNVTYFEKGRYLPDALHEINYLYRDHLTDEVHPVDTALLDQLHDLQSTLGGKKSIHVICGYRSPFTNAHLRRNSRGVARNSLHMEGRAIDIRIAGVDTRTIRDAALSMAQGGVGYYPGSNFVHLDTGDFRTW